MLHTDISSILLLLQISGAHNFKALPRWKLEHVHMNTMSPEDVCCSHTWQRSLTIRKLLFPRTQDGLLSITPPNTLFPIGLASLHLIETSDKHGTKCFAGGLGQANGLYQQASKSTGESSRKAADSESGFFKLGLPHVCGIGALMASIPVMLPFLSPLNGVSCCQGF